MFHVVSLSRNYRVAASPPPSSCSLLFRCLLSAVVQLIKRFRLLLCILFALYLSLPSTLLPFLAFSSLLSPAFALSVTLKTHFTPSLQFFLPFSSLSSLTLSCLHSVFSGSTYTNQHIKFRVASRAAPRGIAASLMQQSSAV